MIFPLKVTVSDNKGGYAVIDNCVLLLTFVTSFCKGKYKELSVSVSGNSGNISGSSVSVCFVLGKLENTVIGPNYCLP